MTTPPATSASALVATLQRAQQARNLVVAGMLTSHRCPWCVALRKEQLDPRMRASQAPQLMVVEFDVDDTAPIQFPDGKQRTARTWGDAYGMTLTPTVAMLDRMARPLAPPLVGYGSRDFYGAYLEEQIRIAHGYWQSRHNDTP